MGIRLTEYAVYKRERKERKMDASIKKFVEEDFVKFAAQDFKEIQKIADTVLESKEMQVVLSNLLKVYYLGLDRAKEVYLRTEEK